MEGGSLNPDARAKEETWANTAREIDEIVDATGRGIDKGIKESVIALNVNGISTSQSCEGHAEVEGGHRPWPWVEVSAPNEPAERFVGQAELFEESARAHGVQVDELKRGRPEELYWNVVRKASENPETPEYKRWREDNLALFEKTKGLLAEFYRDRNVVAEIAIRAEESNGGPFELSSEKALLMRFLEKQLTHAEKLGLLHALPQRQEEMRAFSEFLKQRFIAGQT